MKNSGGGAISFFSLRRSRHRPSYIYNVFELINNSRETLSGLALCAAIDINPEGGIPTCFGQDLEIQETRLDKMKKSIFTLAALLLASCAGSQQPGYTINEVVLVNNSRELLREARVSVPSTGRSFSCGSIAPLGICSNRFAARRYEYNPIQVEWSFGKRSRRTGEFVVQVPANLYAGLPLRAVLEVNRRGGIDTYFQQGTPNN